jgi:hypothetical protein
LAFLKGEPARFALKFLSQNGKRKAMLFQFLGFKSKDFMAVNASCQNYLKAVQYVEARLRIAPLLRVVTSDLTDRNQPVLFHSPFPHSFFVLGR